MAERKGARETDRFRRKREAILDASIPILNLKGVKGLTLAEAAAAVGLSTTSVTYYFKRKDDLAAACMARGVGWLQEAAETANREASPADRLSRLLDLYLDRARLAALGQAAALPTLADLRALSDPRRAEVLEAYVKLFRKVRGLFDAPEMAWMSRGRRTARTHMLLAQLFGSAVWLPKYAPDRYLEVGRRMSDILVGGLAADGAAWNPAPAPLAELAACEPQEINRTTFLLAATRLINSRGYRGASVEKISAALNVTKGSFYHHIDAKDDLVVACFDRTFEVMARVQRLAAGLDGDAWRRLSSAAAALAEYQLSDHGPLLRISALSALPETIRGEQVGRFDAISDGFAALISQGVAEGSIRSVDPEIAAQMLNATLNAGAELAFWVPGITQRAAPSVFARPSLMGVFVR